MRYVYNTSTDPAFNLAAEEWLLSGTTTEIFMLWRNAPAVIVGRNQNTLSQINEVFVRERNIPVIRRLSGGGAVFHDLGNINFTFISLGNSPEGLNFTRFTSPILEALRGMGVACEFDGRNDLVIDGRKFSGNAQHVAKDRVLHHGTLLFASEVEDISGALRVDPEKYRDKAVKSVRSRITNIASHLPEPMSVSVFMDRLMAHVSGEGHMDGGLAELGLTSEEVRQIETLAESKYRTWDWNYGYSPKYDFERVTRTPGGVLDVRMNVDGGVLRAIRLHGDYFGIRDVGELEARLVGCRHNRAALLECLADVPLGEFMQGVDGELFVDCLF